MKEDKVMLPRWFKLVTVVLAVLLITTLSFAAGFGLCSYRSLDMQHPLGETPEEYADDFRIFWEAWHIVEENFYHPEHQPDSQDMTYGAIRGALSSLGDPNTNFTEPVYAAIFDEDMGGSFEGIGATVNMQDGQVVIVRPLPGSPAETAGLLPADVILEVVYFSPLEVEPRGESGLFHLRVGDDGLRIHEPHHIVEVRHEVRDLALRGHRKLEDGQSGMPGVFLGELCLARARFSLEQQRFSQYSRDKEGLGQVLIEDIHVRS